MRDRIHIATSLVLVLLLLGCASRPPHRFSGDYLGYDEGKAFRVDEDESYGADRAKYLMKYWSLSEVETIDRERYEQIEKHAIFTATKAGWFYFSIPFDYEHYVWGPHPENPDLITTIAKYWVKGLNRYRIKKESKAARRQPNQALQTTPITRSVYEKSIEFGHPQRGV